MEGEEEDERVREEGIKSKMKDGEQVTQVLVISFNPT